MVQAEGQEGLPRNTDASGPSSSDFSSSSPLFGPPLTPTLLFDKPQNVLSYGITELSAVANTPPPRPPKPAHFLDRKTEEQLSGVLQNGHAGICAGQGVLVPRRISLSSLDSMRNWKGKATLNCDELISLGQSGSWKVLIQMAFNLSLCINVIILFLFSIYFH